MEVRGLIPNYSDLDLSGEALQAAARMEARAQEPASRELFRQLVAPLLTDRVKTVCEFGCGTAALSRKIVAAAPNAAVYAGDKSQGMLRAARRMIALENLTNIHVQPWDILDERAFPFPVTQFDLIISSVVVPYLDDTQTIRLVERLVQHLAPSGVLAFVEQDLMTDTLNHPDHALTRAVLGKDQRSPKRTIGLGLRPVLREAGLHLLPRRSFLWTDDTYGPYTRDLLERFANAAHDQGIISSAARDTWMQALNDLAASGDFFYGIVYHLIAGRRL